MSKLVQGKIPVATVCPFRSMCPYAKNKECGHKGVDHTVVYSCGAARLFDIMGTSTEEGK